MERIAPIDDCMNQMWRNLMKTKWLLILVFACLLAAIQPVMALERVVELVVPGCRT